MFDLSKSKKKNICIIGLMGSGKSIIGKELSRYLNLNFYDTDREIELKTKKSINLGKKKFILEKGSRIAQMVLCPIIKAKIIEVESLQKTDRGSGGFGSTGK